MLKLLSIIISGILLFNINTISVPKETNTTKSGQKEEQMIVTEGNFNEKMLQLINKTDKKNENYMFSPLSFKYAFSMLAAGVSGEAKNEILSALDYSSEKEMLADFNIITEDIKNLDIEFDIANSIWYNETVGGNNKVKEEYKNKLSNYFNAEYFSKQGKDFSSSINKWVSDNTHKKINKIASAENDTQTILALINALYMNSNWETAFKESNNKKDNFLTIDNEKVTKTFMSNTFKNIPYYEDKNTQIIGLTFDGQATMYFVIGDTTNIEEKIKQCKIEKKVFVLLPKYEIETTFKNDLKNITEDLGIKTIFSPDKDTFSEIFDNSSKISVSDIIQKTFLKVEEKGVEAAAVTAIMMTKNAMIEESEPKEFIADKPFSFYIYIDDENNNPKHLTFFGQYVK